MSETISEAIIKNKTVIYAILLYLAGLFAGTVIYKTADYKLTQAVIENIFSSDVKSFLNLFLNKLSIYISIYSSAVLLGMCLIGFPLIYLIPVLTGLIISFKIAYYYSSFGIKGVGYSLLLIIPESAALQCVMTFTICRAVELSKLIYSSTVKKTDMTKDNELKSYLKVFIIYFGLTALTALINTSVQYLLSGLITF